MAPTRTVPAPPEALETSARRGRVSRALLWLVPAVVVLAGLPLYVFPAQAVPARSDVVYVLGSPDGWRISWAEQLVREGRAGAMLISVPSNQAAPSTCGTPSPFEVDCVHPDSATTEGEARALRAAMAAHGWRTAVAITSTPHVLRASLILRQCVPQGVSVVGRPTGIDLGGWISQYAYQSAALVKAIAAPAC